MSKKQPAYLLTYICLFTVFLCSQAFSDINPSGKVTNEDGTIHWDWFTAIPDSGDDVCIGNNGDGYLVLNPQAYTNGLIHLYCDSLEIGYGDNDSGSMTMDGPGTDMYFERIMIAGGASSSGTFTMRNFAEFHFEIWKEVGRIVIGRGQNSSGAMYMKDQSAVTLGDFIRMGVRSGSNGLLVIEDGSSFECLDAYIGKDEDGSGKVIVDGGASSFTTRRYAYIPRKGTGQFIIKNGATVQINLRAELGHQSGSHGTVTVHGQGSTLSVDGPINVGRGNNNPPDQLGEGLLELKKGGKVEAHRALVGQSSYNPKGTLSYTIGNSGGSIACGIMEADNVELNNAYLQMHVEPGVELSEGMRFTLVDYDQLGTPLYHTRFNDIDEGDILTSPRGYHFQINYATDLGEGDQAITATVATIPPCFVDTEDLQLLVLKWLEQGCSADDWCGGADIDGSGEVEMNDFAHLAEYWMSPCPENWPWQ